MTRLFMSGTHLLVLLNPFLVSVYLMLCSRRTPDGPLITGKSMPLEVASLAAACL